MYLLWHKILRLTEIISLDISRMGKGEGSGEGWGEGQGNGGEWKGDLCSSCNAGTKCKYIVHVLCHKNYNRLNA